MDKLIIEGLKVDTIVGVWDWEKITKQPVKIDLEISVDIEKASQVDELSGAVDYGAMCDYVANFLAEQKCELIETLAQRLVTELKSKFSLEYIKLKLTKPAAVPMAERISVLVER